MRMVRFSSSPPAYSLRSWLNPLYSLDQGLCVCRYRSLGYTHYPCHIRGPRLGRVKRSYGSSYASFAIGSRLLLLAFSRFSTCIPPRHRTYHLIGCFLACLCDYIVWICHWIIHWGRWFCRHHGDVDCLHPMIVSECILVYFIKCGESGRLHRKR